MWWTSNQAQTRLNMRHFRPFCRFPGLRLLGELEVLEEREHALIGGSGPEAREWALQQREAHTIVEPT